MPRTRADLGSTVTRTAPASPAMSLSLEVTLRLIGQRIVERSQPDPHTVMRVQCQKAAGAASLSGSTGQSRLATNAAGRLGVRHATLPHSSTRDPADIWRHAMSLCNVFIGLWNEHVCNCGFRASCGTQRCPSPPSGPFFPLPSTPASPPLHPSGRWGRRYG